jgi:hypothetical protein
MHGVKPIITQSRNEVLKTTIGFIIFTQAFLPLGLFEPGASESERDVTITAYSVVRITRRGGA